MAPAIQQYILRLAVSVHDPLPVKVTKAKEDPTGVEPAAVEE